MPGKRQFFKKIQHLWFVNIQFRQFAQNWNYWLGVLASQQLIVL